MRTIATVALVLALASSVAQAYYPVDLSVSFDANDSVDRIDPAAYTGGHAFIMARVVGGIERVAFTVYATEGMTAPPSADITCFHPDAVTISGGFGDMENGWIIEAPECVTPDEDGWIILARIELFYLGTPGEIVIEPHPIEDQTLHRCIHPCGDYSYRICGAGGVLMDPRQYGGLCGLPEARVICEEQGGANPVHPPTYWYDATTGYDGPATISSAFHVQVFDPDIANYTNWVEPAFWTHSDSVIQVGDELWVSWWDTTDYNPIPIGVSWHRFGFDNPNPPTWGSWTITRWSDPDPYAEIIRSDADYPDEADGYGRRVHVPCAGASPVECGSWGTIKALYK